MTDQPPPILFSKPMVLLQNPHSQWLTFYATIGRLSCSIGRYSGVWSYSVDGVRRSVRVGEDVQQAVDQLAVELRDVVRKSAEAMGLSITETNTTSANNGAEGERTDGTA